MIGVIVLYALLALTFPLAQYAVQFAHPVFLIAIRMLIAGMCLLSYHVFVNKHFKIAQEDIILFFKVSFFHIYLSFIPEFWSLQYLSAIKVNVLYCMTPFVAAFLEYILLKKHLEKYKIWGIIIGTLGITPIIFSFNNCESLKECVYPFLPEGILFVSIVSATYAWFLVKELLNKGYPLPFINGIAMISGGALSLLTYSLFYKSSLAVVSYKPFFISTFALIILSNIIVYNLYGFLIKKHSITFIGLAGFLSPIFGVLYARFFFNQNISWHYILACGMISIGLWIFYQEEKKS